MILIPIKCPSCNLVLERVKDQIFCRNSTCEAKSSKMLLHYIKVMKIKGLGEKTLEKLDIETINDLYNLTNSGLVAVLGEKIGNKIFNEIDKSKSIELSMFITAFGIQLIGKSAAEKLVSVIKSLWDINAKLCKTAGLGEKATDNLLNWVYVNKETYSNLPVITYVSEIVKPETILYTVVITGKLNDFTSRSKAKVYLESIGIKVLSSLSSKVNFLICDVESKTSSSCKKAISVGIPIISMKELLNI